jgi:hypothetical protein
MQIIGLVKFLKPKNKGKDKNSGLYFYTMLCMLEIFKSCTLISATKLALLYTKIFVNRKILEIFFILTTP